MGSPVHAHACKTDHRLGPAGWCVSVSVAYIRVRLCETSDALPCLPYSPPVTHSPIQCVHQDKQNSVLLTPAHGGWGTCGVLLTISCRRERTRGRHAACMWAPLEAAGMGSRRGGRTGLPGKRKQKEGRKRRKRFPSRHQRHLFPVRVSPQSSGLVNLISCKNSHDNESWPPAGTALRHRSRRR